MPDGPHRPGGWEQDPPALAPETPAEGTGRAAPASLVVNSSWLLASRVTSVVVGGALSIYAIRTLSVDEWGRYSAILSLIVIATVVTEAGLSSLTLREISARPEREASTIATAMSAVLLTGAVAIVAAVGAAVALGYWEQPEVVLVAAGVIAFQAVATPLFSIFNAHRVLVYPALLSGAGAVVAAGVGAGLIAAGSGPVALLLGMLGAQALAAVAGYVLLRSRLGLRARPRRPDRQTRDFLRAALPIAATGGLTILYQRVDILMLSKLDGDAAVAIYAVPYTLVQYSWMIPQVVAAAYFPLLVAAMREDRADAERSFFLIVRLFFLASLPVTLFLVVGGGPLLSVVFGDEYRDSASVLTIMAWISVLGFQNYVLWYGILAAGREKLVVAIQTGGLVVNVALNAVLIPSFGPNGAAAALVVSDLIVVAGQAVIVHREVFPIPWRRIFASPVAAGVVTGGVVAALLPISSLLAATVGAPAYALLLLGARYVTWEEWAPLRAPLAGLARRLPGLGVAS